MKKIKYVEITDDVILKFIPLNSLELSVRIKNEIRKITDWKLSNGDFIKTGNKKLIKKIVDCADDYHNDCYVIYSFEKYYSIDDFYNIRF
ncbi:hypothetical protein ACE2A4_004542 [Salmonella enterica]|uniref:hypothetical protein n=1 Tax=Enterobacteriaceae TaxID=543 RepID=UPI0007C6AF9E|nr:MULTISPECIES: hypothetical protein [Enterobacteriaceae]EDS7657975.1 hypothetical protein [Salmonella enterica subsp. enterica serovar Oranienburg]EEB6502784.1 hypothetical protein [Salmonella enterica]HBU5092399.1 hypothetical protein [Klebsiella pneumoniae]HCR5855132.1 hypothetical protein [Shigella flexneri]HDU3663293.1 hypothetical protein [Klebsiella pneumoniae subsp. pneumoniae]